MIIDIMLYVVLFSCILLIVGLLYAIWQFCKTLDVDSYQIGYDDGFEACMDVMLRSVKE